MTDFIFGLIALLLVAVVVGAIAAFFAWDVYLLIRVAEYVGAWPF